MASSYHTSRGKQPAPPPRHRSSSATRTAASPRYGNRPRSAGYFGSNGNLPYGSGLSSFSAYNSPYASSYQSPYFANGYRGAGAAGYASLTIPAKSFATNYSKSYDNAREYAKGLARGNSYREKSLSRSRNSLPGMGSRSLSLTSLGSEGYVSGSDRGGGRSRLSSTVDIRNENGEIDYKKLYEEQLAENDRLKDKLRKTDEELRDTKQTLEKINVVTSKNSLSELEKRERRAMERKLSEMEEELKQLQKLKAENERLKADNRSLTRVINKLTNSTKK